MQINNYPNIAQVSTNFRGSVDSAVINKLKVMEKDLIKEVVRNANFNKTSVDSKVIEMIKSRFLKVVEELKEKAQSLFKDSVITLRDDTGQIYVKNKKLNHQYSNILESEYTNYDNLNFINNFSKDLHAKYYANDPIVRAEYMRLPYDYTHLQHGLPRNISELEVMTKLFEPEKLNKHMLMKEREELVDQVRWQKSVKPNLRIKKQVKDVIDVEKELAPKDRYTGLWNDVKEQMQKNLDQKTLEKENAKYLK